MANPLQIIEDLIASLKGAGVVPHEGGEEEAKKFMEPGAAGAIDEDPNAPPAEPVAEDDALEDALTELFALADSVADEELAMKLKAVGESIRQSQGGAPAGDEDPETGTAEDEDPEAMHAEDEDPAPGEEKKEEKMASDRRSVKKGRSVSYKKSGNVYNINLANDAAIARGVEARMNAKFVAAREVRSLIGEVDPLAFDSAAGIYRAALKAHGTETRVNDVTALRQMVKLAKDARPRDVYPVVAALANDSRGKDDPNFAGLGRIRKA